MVSFFTKAYTNIDLLVWKELRKPIALPPSLAEKQPITPIKENAVYPSPISSNSSGTFHSRQSSMQDVYEKAKLRGVALQRKHWVRLLFECGVYVLLILIIYFVLVGMPLWKGAVWWLYWIVSNKFVIQGGWAILIGMAFL